MDSKIFQKIMYNQFERCSNMLTKKEAEYATDDRLHNFRVAAILQNEGPQQALQGMLAKHTVSLNDMMSSKKEFPIEVWDEKITDHINYLVLLRAMIEESIFLKYHPECMDMDVTKYYKYDDIAGRLQKI